MPYREVYYLGWVSAPHFFAGLGLNKSGTVVQTAPILSYMMGWNGYKILSYCDSKRWLFKSIELKLEDKKVALVQSTSEDYGGKEERISTRPAPNCS